VDGLKTREGIAHFAYAIALACLAGAAFYLPALHATHGDWPAPLDDVFIHFDFARSWASGHPFEWIAGQGYSSGETSPLYAIVLAIGYAIGFRAHLGVWAAFIAIASMVSLLRSMRALILAMASDRDRRVFTWLAWIAAPMFVAIGVLDWSWFSGMEIALFGAILGRTWLATWNAREASLETHRSKEARAALWCALLVITRPEAIVIAFVVAVAVARRAGDRSGFLTALRVALPSVAATIVIASLNVFFTGEAQSAGALLKLLSQNPNLTDVDRAIAFVINLAFVRFKILGAQVTVWPSTWFVLPLLACASLASRRTRALGAASIASALAFTLLVSWNSAAQFQNGRYYMPALLLVIMAAMLGTLAIASYEKLRAFAFLCPAIVTLLALPRVRAQIDFFRDASANIRDQQVEVGLRLARTMPIDARVLIGDAGAIPYISERHAIDALGLGGYRGLPFVTSSVSGGEASTVELLERLRPDERPSYMALYPNWFGAITRNFGHEIDRITIAHNVICGGASNVIYAADWSALGAADDLKSAAYFDSLDVADVISEKDHGYESPAPRGGWSLLDVRSTRDREKLFDGGRIIPNGASERFTALHDSRSNNVAITIRIDDTPCDIDIDVTRASNAIDRVRANLVASTSPSPAWHEARGVVRIAIAKGDVITITAHNGDLHNFHVWLSNIDDALSSQ
jgi:hypothetical protein